MKEDVVAVYCRLSKEDLDKDIGKTVSESIKNQKSMLEEYALNQHWKIYDFYIDEDYSGSDRERPEFNRLITDSLLGRFNIVLCKKQARFARDIEYVEKYIHGIFAERQIRFIALLDNIDTAAATRTVRRASQINSLVDEWYLADLSDNVVSALTAKRKNAEFIGSWAPYGYKKDPANKNSLLIDEPAAEIVREIFEQYAQGTGVTAIANKLNRDQIPNPLTYKQRNGENINPNPIRRTKNAHLWSPGTISNILRSQTYIGDLVQGKYRKASYKSKKLLRTNRSEWIIVPHCHEPIIDNETWLAVQSRIKAGTRTVKDGKHHQLLAGKVFCEHCGSKLIFTGGSSGNRKTTYLCCSKHRKLPQACIGVRIEASKLEEQVLNRLNSLADQYFDEEFILKQLADNLNTNGPDESNQSDNAFNSIQFAQLKNLKERLDRINKKLDILYNDKLNEIISVDQYLNFREQINCERERLQQECAELEARTIGQHSQTHDRHNLPHSTITKFKNIPVLTQELVNQFIESVYLSKRITGEPQEIRINWRF